MAKVNPLSYMTVNPADLEDHDDRFRPDYADDDYSDQTAPTETFFFDDPIKALEAAVKQANEHIEWAFTDSTSLQAGTVPYGVFAKVVRNDQGQFGAVVAFEHEPGKIGVQYMENGVGPGFRHIPKEADPSFVHVASNMFLPAFNKETYGYDAKDLAATVVALWDHNNTPGLTAEQRATLNAGGSPNASEPANKRELSLAM